jgi:hypothetical protein
VNQLPGLLQSYDEFIQFPENHCSQRSDCSKDREWKSHYKQALSQYQYACTRRILDT